MGLNIRVCKPLKKVSEELAERDNVCELRPAEGISIDQFSLYEGGWYEVRYLRIPRFHMPYSTFNAFRNEVAMAVYGADIGTLWYEVGIGGGEPMTEFLYSSDSDGCFDHVVAEKMFRDFLDNRSKMSDSEYLDVYETYTKILRIAVREKAVIMYR